MSGLIAYRCNIRSAIVRRALPAIEVAIAHTHGVPLSIFILFILLVRGGSRELSAVRLLSRGRAVVSSETMQQSYYDYYVSASKESSKESSKETSTRHKSLAKINARLEILDWRGLKMTPRALYLYVTYVPTCTNMRLVYSRFSEEDRTAKEVASR